MAWDSQYLWAARSDRTIDKIDVINKTVVETFTHNGMGTDYTRWRDLTWAGNYLWAVSNADGSDDSDTSKIYKIDPTDGSFLYSKTLTFDTNYRAQGLTWDGTNFHVLKENDLLYKVDSTNFNPLSSFSLQPDHQPIGPNQYIGLTNVAWDGAYFWTASQNDGKIFQYDPVTGKALLSFDAPLGVDPQGIAFDGNDLWISKYNTQTGNPDIAYGTEYYKISRSDGHLIDRITSSESGPVPEPTTMLLLGAGLVGLAGFGRKKFKK